MPMTTSQQAGRMDADAGFASVYDVIYDDPRLLAAQLAFLQGAFADASGWVLDAGCGTGMHLLPLRARGYRAVGVDLSAAMLAVAHGRLAEAALRAPLVQADIRSLPFASTFSGVLCLDSPLALILEDAGLEQALAGFHRCLRPGGVLVIEVYDYVRSVDVAHMAPQTCVIPAPWGRIAIRESHRHDRDRGRWEMTQEFTVSRADRRDVFTVTHRLRMRTLDTYAAAIERAGFHIQEALSSYPGEVGAERRMIFTAQRR